MEETQLARKKWAELYHKVLNDESFNRILLTKDYKEIDDQKSMAKEYIEESMELKKYMSNQISLLKSKFHDLGPNNKHANEFIRDYEIGYKRRQSTVFSLIDEHIKYGNNLLELLSFLEKNTENWSYKDEPKFADSVILEQYILLLNKIENNENTINTLEKKLIDLM